MVEAHSSQAHVARGATFVFIQGFVNSILGVVYVWFLLHSKDIVGQVFFTDADMGLFTILTFILSLTSTLGVLALRSASVKYIAQYLAEGKRKDSQSVMTRVLQFSLITSTAILLILFGLSSILFNVLTGSPEITYNSILIFQLLPLSSFLMIFYTQGQGFLIGLQKMRELSIIGVMYTIIRYSVGILLVYSGLGVFGIVVSWVFSMLLASIVSLLLTFRFSEFSRDVHKIKPLLTFSLPIYISSLLIFVVSWIDQIFVFPFLGIAALGVYNLAVRASVVPKLVGTALNTTLYPKLSEMYSAFGIKSLRDAFKTSTRYAALIGFPISLLVATLAYPIIVLFATVQFKDAALPLAVMCIAALPTILGSAILPTLYTLERTKTASLITICSILLEALLAYVFLAFLKADLAGVAFSRLLSELTRFTLGVFVLRSILKIQVDKEAVWKAAIASMIMVLSILTLELLRSFFDSSYQFLVLRLRLLPIYSIIGLGIYCFSLIILKAIREKDIKLLHDYLPSSFRWVANLLSRIARIKA